MKDYLELLSSVGKLKKFQKNSILFYEGEEAKKFFILLKGKIRIYKSTASDKEITLHTSTSTITLSDDINLNIEVEANEK